MHSSSRYGDHATSPARHARPRTRGNTRAPGHQPAETATGAARNGVVHWKAADPPHRSEVDMTDITRRHFLVVTASGTLAAVLYPAAAEATTAVDRTPGVAVKVGNGRVSLG